MAPQNHFPKPSRNTVPVVSRSRPKPQAPKIKPRRDKLDIAGYAVLSLVSIVVMLAVSVPLNNYYAGRAEITRLNESIAAKQAEKERLLTDIEKYRSESYIQQEARRRLGVVAPGETAYRILDPQMNPDSSATTDHQEQLKSQPWYDILWDSVAEPTDIAPAPEG